MHGVQGRARVDNVEAERQRKVTLSQKNVRDFAEQEGLIEREVKVSGAGKTAQIIEWVKRQLGVDVVETTKGDAKILSTVTEPFVLAAGQGPKVR